VSGTEPGRSRTLTRRRAWTVTFVVLLGLLAARATRRPAAAAPAAEGTRTAVVERRDFAATVRIHGVVEAARSHTVVVPRLSGAGGGGMVVTRLAAAGSQVKPGDVVVQLDAQGQVKNFLDRQADHRDRLAQLQKKEADRAAARARDERELKEAEHAFEAARLEVRRNEILSRIDAEKNDQTLQETQARLAQVREVVRLRARAFEAEQKILEIQRDRAAEAMQHASRNVERMTLRAPIAGLVVLQSIWKVGQMSEVAEGDEVNSGMPVVQIVDVETMQVRARVNQADIRRLQVGQRVRVTLDAYPDTSFPGALVQVGAIATPGSFSEKVRYTLGLFSLEKADPRLMPDLSAAVDVELTRRPGSLVVPRDAVTWDSGKAFLHVRKGPATDRRAVTLGPMCDHQAVVLSGVEEGAVVVRRPLSPS
jgi:HlyD family secretion protein